MIIYQYSTCLNLIRIREVVKAQDFYAKLSTFITSCEEWVRQVGGCQPRRFRIAVLDTGVDNSDGNIQGGFKEQRIQKKNCRSWVGSDHEDIRDDDGHGTFVTTLLLKYAPWADIYICKVLKGKEICEEEVNHIANVSAEYYNK